MKSEERESIERDVGAGQLKLLERMTAAQRFEQAILWLRRCGRPEGSGDLYEGGPYWRERAVEHPGYFLWAANVIEEYVEHIHRKVD